MIKNVLIRNARIFNAGTGEFSHACDIRIENGIVAEIAPDIKAKPGYDIVEEEDLCASTGWTDCHTHVGGFDPFLTYPGLGVTRVHEAGSAGAFGYPRLHEMLSRLPFPVTTYLYVGVYGVGSQEIKELANIQEAPFLEIAKEYPDEIVGAKIRIDPRVNCDTRKSLRMAKDLAVKAGLPLIVHPSRCQDGVEEILAVMDKDDVYAHTYSPVSPGIFDENGRIKKALWEARERGVRFDLSHGTNNFGYDMARSAVKQGFVVDTISTDLHKGNYTKAGINLAGVITKAIQVGICLNDALKMVIVNPSKLLHVDDKPETIEVGQIADITLFTVSRRGEELPDSIGRVETCGTVVKDVATIIGATLNRSFSKAIPSEGYAAEN